MSPINGALLSPASGPIAVRSHPVEGRSVVNGAIATEGAEGRVDATFPRRPEPVCDIRSAGSLMGLLMAACDEHDLRVDDTGTMGGFRVLTGSGWAEVLIAVPRHFPATDQDADRLDELERREANSHRPTSDQFPAIAVA